MWSLRKSETYYSRLLIIPSKSYYFEFITFITLHLIQNTKNVKIKTCLTELLPRAETHSHKDHDFQQKSFLAFDFVIYNGVKLKPCTKAAIYRCSTKSFFLKFFQSLQPSIYFSVSLLKKYSNTDVFCGFYKFFLRNFYWFTLLQKTLPFEELVNWKSESSNIIYQTKKIIVSNIFMLLNKKLKFMS